MSGVGPKEHFWTWQPYLDFWGSYCDRCGKVKRQSDNKIISHTQALKEVWQQHPEMHEEIKLYTYPRTLARILKSVGV